MKDWWLIVGPPGTGKTTTLLSYVVKALKKGHHFYFLTFSRAAAAEAFDRLKEKDEVQKEDKQFFRTIHSFCMKVLGIKFKQMMTDKDYNAIALTCGVPQLVGKYYRQAALPAFATEHYISHYDKQRSSKKDVFANIDENLIKAPQFKQFVEALENYKKKNFKYDFVDLLLEGGQKLKDARISLDCLFIDEAQDLNPLQWDIVDVLIHKSKKVVIAGDDDQEIYHFAGANCKRMLEYANEGFQIKQLQKSHRLPAAIYDLSQNLIGRVKGRINKEFKPNRNLGHIHSSDDLWNLREHFNVQGDWIALARTNYLKEKYQYEFENLFPKMKDKVKFLTIHESKGQEATNVILYTQLTRKVMDNYDPERETKLFYVGVTRAKSRLLVIKGDENSSFPLLCN